MNIVDVLQTMAPLAAFVGGYAACAAQAHREARLQYKILWTLAMEGPLVGVDMVKRGLGKRGTIYVRLNRMEDLGLIESEPEKERRRLGYLCRRAYRLTEAGRAALKVEKARSGAA